MPVGVIRAAGFGRAAGGARQRFELAHLRADQPLDVASVARPLPVDEINTVLTAATREGFALELGGAVQVQGLWQDFPNQHSLATALHERHGVQMYAAIKAILAAERTDGLRGHVQAVERAILAAHRVQPHLHRVLERKFPFFDAPRDQSPADASNFPQVRQLFQAHRHEITPNDPDLATWMALQAMESLAHGAVIEPPALFGESAVEVAIVQMLMGYLTTPKQ